MALTTSVTLLQRLQQGGDEAAWRRFYGFYAPLIIGFCLRRGCTRAMADDILQETMVDLMRQMPAFTYDPQRGRFRSFVLKIAHRRAIKAWCREGRYISVDTGSKSDWVASLADSQAKPPLPDWDALFGRRLLQEGLSRVRERVSTQVFRSFELTAIQGRPVGEVMAELGVETANAVYQHRNRVMRYLEEAVADLRQEMDP